MSEEFFVCEQCGDRVEGGAVGTEHRNHCPNCLWSKHLDGKVPGDRSSNCGAMMKPVGLCFKKEQGKVGELMVVHRCMVCSSVSKNRIAGDDQPGALEHLFTDCCALSAEEKSELMAKGIELLSEKDEYEVTSQLYGRPEAVKRQQNA